MLSYFLFSPDTAYFCRIFFFIILDTEGPYTSNLSVLLVHCKQEKISFKRVERQFCHIYLLVTIVLKIVVFFRMVGGTWSKTHKHPSQITPQNQIVLGWASLPFPVKFDYLFTCPWQLKGKEKGRTFSAFRRTYLFLTCL